MPDGSSNASAMESSVWGALAGCLNATFMDLTPPAFCLRHPDCFLAGSYALVVQRLGRGAQHRRGRDVGEDTVVTDHDRRRQDVPQMPSDAELAVVAVAGEPASLHRARHS